MSRSPTSPLEYDEVAPPAAISTRTVAIIKNHALTHRFDIEPRILEASFEVRGLLAAFDRRRELTVLIRIRNADCQRKADGI